MFDIIIPDKVQIILDLLNKNNFEAFAVGGCVRDSFLGRIPHDWDICTSATPEQMLECFKDYKTIETGLKHGTLTVMLDNEAFEVTTYRVDGEYTDNRHPDKVIFVDDIEKDLSRRDITINAMAYHPQKGLVDFFGGYEDLQNKIIRCVGNPDHRFNEDALRIMRVLRFASTYGFTIEKETENSLRKNKALLHNIAVERINTELCKLLKGPGAKDILLDYKEIIGEIIPEFVPCFDFNQNNPYHQYDVYSHIVHALDNYDGSDFYSVLALFFHDIGKPLCYSEDEKGGHFYDHGTVSGKLTEKILKRMRFDNVTVKNVTELVLHHNIDIHPSKKVIRKWLNKLGEEQFKRLLDIQKADILAHSDMGRMKKLNDLYLVFAKFEEVLEEQSCFSLKDLAVNGKDLIAAGISEGPEIGKTLNKLLEMVINEEIENDKEKLMKILK